MMRQPYASYCGLKPSKASLLLKAASAKNAQVLREKTVAEHREMLQKLAAVRLFPLVLHGEEMDCGGVRCELITHKERSDPQVILYLHGGSWAFGDLKTARAMGALLAESTHCQVLVADYRLSPEHPFPAGLEDAFAVYRWLLELGIPSEQIALAGDSAGGNLSLCLLHKLRIEGLPFPGCAALASPVTDLREDCALLQSHDDLLYTIHEGQETDIFSMYLQGADRESPLVSPILGELGDLCPILIHVGADEPLAVDNEAFARTAWEAGSPVHVKIWNGMFHDFTVVGVTLKESRLSISELSGFIRSSIT